MISPPESFVRDYQRITRRISQAATTENHRFGPVPTARTLLAAIQAFLDRWQDDPEAAAASKDLADLRAMHRDFSRSVEAYHIAALRELLEFRRDCLLSESAVNAGNNLLETYRKAAPEDRAEYLQRFRKSFPGSPNPEAEMKKCAAKAKKRSFVFRRTLEEYEDEWPDRLQDADYLRILTLALPDHSDIVQNLEARAAANELRG